ncbi:Uncharacterised protein [Mycobacteroides abscessus subsp. abscessus]|nr:Uncharacterised protein [Mycobacteroides abscessus subsp. abscessus]
MSLGQLFLQVIDVSFICQEISSKFMEPIHVLRPSISMYGTEVDKCHQRSVDRGRGGDVPVSPVVSRKGAPRHVGVPW